MRNLQRGFTLIEMIIVLVIIGIVTGIALLAFSNFGAKQHLAQQVQLTQGVLQYARQDAIVNQDVSGVQFFADGYRLVQLQQINGENKITSWQPISAAVNHQSKVSYSFSATKHDASKLQSKESLVQQQVIAFTPSGAVFGDMRNAPYTITLTLKSDNSSKVITVAGNGSIVLAK